MNAERKHEIAVEDWMLSIIRDGGIERFDDLHVDQIDPQWRSRDYWIAAGQEVLIVALRLRERYHLPFAVTLAFSLEPTATLRGSGFGTSADLLNLLDWSPPSLYLFPLGQEPWRPATAQESETTTPQELVVRTLNVAGVFKGSTLEKGYLVEFRSSASDEYSRTLFVSD